MWAGVSLLHEVKKGSKCGYGCLPNDNTLDVTNVKSLNAKNVNLGEREE